MKTLRVEAEIHFQEGDLFEVDGELVRTLRLYDDGGWELLDANENPIQQGNIESVVFFSLKHFKNRVPISTDRPEEKKP